MGNNNYVIDYENYDDKHCDRCNKYILPYDIRGK